MENLEGIQDPNEEIETPEIETPEAEIAEPQEQKKFQPTNQITHTSTKMKSSHSMKGSSQESKPKKMKSSLETWLQLIKRTQPTKK